MILKILVVAACAVIALLAFAATRPNTVAVERSAIVNAPPERVFALIDNFRNWPQWAPQDKEDATIRRTFSGARQGVGAVSDWRGTGSAGQGRMSIVMSVPSILVSVKVDFVKPFEAHNLNEFHLQPEGAATKVIWTMRGSNIYAMKVMGLFVNMDRLMGKHFETGLQDLKAAAERSQ
jgi:uncharacterized protein YndB with AHSA1/START domain